MPAFTVAQLADLCNGHAEGDLSRIINGAESLERATNSDVSFAMNEKAVAASASSRAGCLIVPLSFDNSSSRSIVRVANPRTAFARVLISLYPKTRPAPGIHPTAIIAPSANVGTDCWIGAYVTIGERSEIGSGCFVGEGCRIGTGVFIAQAGILHPNVTLYDNVRIGSRVIIHAGSVLGSDGFGFTRTGDHYEKFPQVGIVEVGDDVEIGANCCIDRAALGATRIGNGVKLDNLVHIAHNCDIGDHVVIAAQTGFSGSVTVGHHAILGGQVGIGEKARIEAESVVGGKAGILTGQTIRAGEPWWGIPARPLRQHLKGLAGVNRLSEFREQLAELRRKFKEI